MLVSSGEDGIIFVSSIKEVIDKKVRPMDENLRYQAKVSQMNYLSELAVFSSKYMLDLDKGHDELDYRLQNIKVEFEDALQKNKDFLL